MLEVLTAIAPLFLIIFASALLKKFKSIGEHWSTVFNDYALKIGLPALIFSALAGTPFSFTENMPLIIANSLFITFVFVLGIFFGKAFGLSKKMLSTLSICFAFGNIAYLGIPVLTKIEGDKILPTVSLIVAIYLFWIFTAVISFLELSINNTKKYVIKNVLKGIVKNPLLLAVVLGLFVGAFGIPIPSVILQSLGILSASVTPLVLIVIGLFVGSSRIGKLSEWFPVLLFSLFTLMVLPMIFYFGVGIFGYTASDFKSSIIEAAMPLAITPFALAEKYNLDKKFIAHSIVLSTILSVFSLPFWLSVI